MSGKGRAINALMELGDKALDMSKEARMARAREMGFDPDSPIFSGSYREPPQRIAGFGEPRPSGGENYFGGIFGSPEKGVAESHGDNVTAFLTKNHADHDSLVSEVLYSEEGRRAAADSVRRLVNGSPTDEEVDEILDYALADVDISESPPDMGLDRLAELIGYPSDDVSETAWRLQGVKGALAKDRGYSSVEMLDEHGGSVLLLPGSGVRRADAAFDSAQKNSPNLLASLAGGGVLTGAALSPEDAAASTQPQSDLQNRLALLASNPNVDLSQNAMAVDGYPLLLQLADGVDNYTESPLGGSHLQGITDLLRKWGYREQATPVDYGMAALDVMP